MRLIVICLIALLSSTSPAAAQEKGEKLCGDCQTTGKIPHPHKESVLEREKDCIYCSVWMDSDPEALCMDWVVCPKCLTPSVQKKAQAEFDLEFGKRKAWLDDRREKVDKMIRSKCDHIRTEHFLISWNIPKIKVGRRIVRQHDAMHLYAERAEELYDYILDLHGITDQQMLGSVFELYMFESERAARIMAPLMTNLALQSEPRIQLVGPYESRMVYWDDNSTVIDDEHRYQYFVHNVSHHIHHDICLGQYKYWLFKRYGWMYEGLAFYLEHRLFGPPKVTCSQETGGFSNYREKSWEAMVKKDVLSGDYPKFQEVISKGADALDDMDRRFSWSYVDYLMWLDPHKMPQLITAMTADQLPTRDCLRKSYGMTVGQFIDGWLAFVKSEYSTRPAKGPIVREPRGGKSPK